MSPDKYTEDTKEWLNNRFRQCDAEGVYRAHRPIYGFRGGPSDGWVIPGYITTSNILKTMSRLEFDSLLDAGAAEGYTTYLVKKIFGTDAECADLSQEACKRAGEIFSLKATPCDMHHLPYGDGTFDVVLCSEALEHVSDPQKVLGEIMRVAKKAVIITVPHETESPADAREPHAHINLFDINSFDHLASPVLRVMKTKMLTSAVKFLSHFIEASPKEYKKGSGRPRFVVSAYNALTPVLHVLFGRRSAAFLAHLDGLLSRILTSYNAALFLIIKDMSAYRARPIKKVSVKDMLDITVPRHYLRKAGLVA